MKKKQLLQSLLENNVIPKKNSHLSSDNHEINRKILKKISGGFEIDKQTPDYSKHYYYKADTPIGPIG